MAGDSLDLKMIHSAGAFQPELRGLEPFPRSLDLLLGKLAKGLKPCFKWRREKCLFWTERNAHSR